MTHSNITVSNSPLNQQSVIANSSELATELPKNKSNFGERIYLAVKDKIKNSHPQEGSKDHDEEVKLSNFFISNPNSLNAKNEENGNNALHIAVLENDLRVAKILTALGINREDKNHENKNPLEFANDLGRKEIFKYLNDLKHHDESQDQLFLQAYKSSPSNSLSNAGAQSLSSGAKTNSR